MVEETAGRSVGSVDRTEEAPRLGQQLPDGGRSHFGEVGAAMDAPEVRQETVKVDLF